MTPELEVYRRFNLPLLYWPRKGKDPKDWKGPHEKGWNDPAHVYDFQHYDPNKHNVGCFTGRDIAPHRYLIDTDFDKPNLSFAKAFFPDSHFAVTRPGKPLSHVLYTTSTRLEGKRAYLALIDNKPYIELRGTKHQTMLPPSLHTPPDTHVMLLASNEIGHTELSLLEAAALDYAIASLVAECFPGGLHHDARLALSGLLLKRQFDGERVLKILQAISKYQITCQIPDMSDYDITDSRMIVESGVARLKNHETLSGSSFFKEVNEDFLKRLRTFLPRTDDPVGVEDFYAYMPKHEYLFLPSSEFWPASSVNARIFPIPTGQIDDKTGEEKTVLANIWLDRHRPVEQAVWAPGFPPLIRDRLVSDGGWIEHPGCSCLNLYRPPQVGAGDPALAEPWLALIRKVYPTDADHLVKWFAQRVQRPQEKINHAVVLGGIPGIGKDTILEPVKTAVGPWNFIEVSPKDMFADFNSYVKSVILRISEVRDLGDVSRYDFYEHMKTLSASPPDVLRCNEKHLREHSVFNVCGPVYTTNYETTGMYLPPNDRRHYVAWSPRVPADFETGYWQDLYAWYHYGGGRRHVAAYLASVDLSNFDPKAPPLKTEAFWGIVGADQSSEDAELADVLDECGNPPVVTLALLIPACPVDGSLRPWLQDRKHSRLIPSKMKGAGYVPFRNPASPSDGLWKIGGKRQVVYVKQELSGNESQKAVDALIKMAEEMAADADVKKGIPDGGL